MRYPTVLLDADETLFDFSKAEYAALKNTFETFGFPFDDAVNNRYHSINQGFWQLFEQGGITQARLRHERFDQLFAELGYSADADAFNRYYTTELSKGTYLIDGAYELCEALHDRCTLHIVTNGTLDTQTNRFALSELRPFFDSIFISEEIGFHKPHAEFFDHVFAHLGISDRSGVILLGDSLTSDMQGGRNAGIVTCWFASDDACANDLYDHRISKLLDFIPIVMG